MKSLESELADIEARLAALQIEQRALLDKRRELLTRGDKGAGENLISGLPKTNWEKAAFFKQLFRAREDVYAVRWEKAAGRQGYALACHNEWKTGLCRKPEIRCSKCAHQSFKPLTTTTYYEHLKGDHTAGIYPLLSDDETWLLAFDFDKDDWQLAASALREVCTNNGVWCAVERSRSGNGAHVWLFFDEPIAARRARQLGIALLDQAMEVHANLSFESYDRMFPNQDTVPEGGFGNLIALPLQRGPRQRSNSVFVDEFFEPYEDQWAFLSRANRLSAEQIAKILKAQDGQLASQVVDLKPWEKGLPLPKDVIPDCPATIEIKLANRLYLPYENLPTALVARLKRVASFSNPEFFKKQANRFSTNGTPRFISLASSEQGYLCLPRGCQDEVEEILAEQSVDIQVEDLRRAGTRLKGINFTGELRPDQLKAVKTLAKHDIGVLQAPTAFGKTVTAIGLIAKRRVNTLILVHSRQLLDQWRVRMTTFLEGCEIGVIGGGKKVASGQVDIGTYQSFLKKKTNEVDERFFDYGQIIVDECHHLPAPRYEALLSEARAKYILGLTATPQRLDGHHPLIFMLAGPIRHSVKSDARHQFDQRVIVRRLQYAAPKELTPKEGRAHIADVYRWLMNNAERNKQLISDVVSQVKARRYPLLLTERREHATLLAELLGDQDIEVTVLRGGMKARDRDEAMDSLNRSQVLIATGKYIGEGFDLPRLDTLFLGMPISWKGSLAQYAGRIQRQVVGKDTVRIYDYVDESLPMLQRMFSRRTKAYEALGYTLVEEVESGLVQANLAFDID